MCELLKSHDPFKRVQPKETPMRVLYSKKEEASVTLTIQELIRRKGWRQGDVCKKIGIHDSQFSQFLLGTDYLPEKYHKSLSELLGVDIKIFEELQPNFKKKKK